MSRRTAGRFRWIWPTPALAVAAALATHSTALAQSAKAEAADAERSGIFLAPHSTLDLKSGTSSPASALIQPLYAYELYFGSAAEAATIQTNQAEWGRYRASKLTIAGAALFTAGLLTFCDDGFLCREEVKGWRDEVFPDFHDDFDDVSQFIPAATALGLNIAGVPGVHSLGRASITYGTELIVQTILVQLSKNVVDVQRPKTGSSLNSFPSGHTATAFGSATFLHKEYGHKSPYYSIGGYGLAAITGVFRQLNDRHWISDVLAGAGIGILSTEIAYLLIDEIAKDKGINPVPPPRPGKGPSDKPSFGNFKFGYAQQTGDLTDRTDVFFAKGGFVYGFEGAYFPTKNFGLGGELSVATFPIDDQNFVPEDTFTALADAFDTSPMGLQSLFVGPFFDLPIGQRFSLTGKVTGGWSSAADSRVTALIKEEFHEEFGFSELTIIEFDTRDSFGVAAGASVRGMISERIGLAVFGEYNFSQHDSGVRQIISVDENGNAQFGPTTDIDSVNFDYFAVGAHVVAAFF